MVTVMLTVCPLSPVPGMYVNEKGVEEAEAGLIEPCPSEDIVTSVALPPNSLPVTVIGVV